MGRRRVIGRSCGALSSPYRPAVRALPQRRGFPWQADPYTRALRSGRGPLFLRRADGWLLPLDVERWCAEPDAADLTVLDRCEGTVLDVGCGPGRMIAALAFQGVTSLGIDVSQEAVKRATRAGGAAIVRSVFDTVPSEGRWKTLLLVDGNIGIGGDPIALLGRAAELLAPQGLLIAEVAPIDIDERISVRLYDRYVQEWDDLGEFFPWARLGRHALLRHARTEGWSCEDAWEAAGRSFVALRQNPRSAGWVSPLAARRRLGERFLGSVERRAANAHM